MIRRCCQCARKFVGAICPGCGLDHVIHVEPTGGGRRATICYCGAPIPRGKGARLRCDACKAAWDSRHSRARLADLTPDQRIVRRACSKKYNEQTTRERRRRRLGWQVARAERSLLVALRQYSSVECYRRWQNWKTLERLYDIANKERYEPDPATDLSPAGLE